MLYSSRMASNEVTYVTTIFSDYGTKQKVTLCATHRHNRIYAGYVYGKGKLASDGNATRKPCLDCLQNLNAHS